MPVKDVHVREIPDFFVICKKCSVSSKHFCSSMGNLLNVIILIIKFVELVHYYL